MDDFVKAFGGWISLVVTAIGGIVVFMRWRSDVVFVNPAVLEKLNATSESQQEQIDELRENLRRTSKELRETEARVDASDQIIRELTVVLEKYHKGSAMLVEQVRGLDATPIWVPMGLSWRGNVSAEED